MHYTSSGTWTHMVENHSFLRTARLPITAYLQKRGIKRMILIKYYEYSSKNDIIRASRIDLLLYPYL